MSTTSERLDTIERFFKLFKEFVLILVFTYLGWFLIPLIPSITNKLGQAQIEQLSLAGVSIKLSQAEQKLEKAIAVNAPQTSNSAKDEHVSPDTMLIAEAWESLHSINKEANQKLTSSSNEKPASITADHPQTTPTSANQNEGAWVYLGVMSGNSLTSKSFSISNLPKEGDIITASADIYKRDAWPRYSDQENWKLGGATGVIRAGQMVKINKVQTIASKSDDGNIVWIKVADVSP